VKIEKISSLIASVALVCACIAPLNGCSSHAPAQKAQEYNDQLHRAINAPIVSTEQAPYLGAVPVTYSRDYTRYPIFSAESSLNMRGTLQEVASTIATMLQLSVQVEPDALESDVSVHVVNFEGKVLALLDYLSTQFGVAWEYDAKTNTVAFSRMQVRTFPILAAPGALKHSTQMSSSSAQGSNSNNNANGSQGNSGSSTGTNSGSDTSSDTSQSLDTAYAVDVWADTEKGIKALLSPTGSVTLNKSAGSVTVRDSVPVMRQVSSYIDEMNNTMLRQVALSVKVWSVEITNDTEVDMNVSLLFLDSFKMSTGTSPLSGLGTGSLTATIVEGNLKDSSATLKALNTLGKASQVTSGSGVIMNNQPLPVQNVKRQSYLGSVSSYTPSTGGNSTALQPSQVTYGFAMTVIPNILDRRRCVLQYNVGLSTLDRMDEVKSGQNNIQLPVVSMRSFNQRAFMNMGQTLVLAGFEQERDVDQTSSGIFALGHKQGKSKNLMVITITVQSMNS